MYRRQLLDSKYLYMLGTHSVVGCQVQCDLHLLARHVAGSQSTRSKPVYNNISALGPDPQHCSDQTQRCDLYARRFMLFFELERFLFSKVFIKMAG